jgi:electron transport complex protein RnfD
MENKLELILESSPHLKSNDSTPKIMYTVILLLIPICAVGIYYFGWAALSRILVGVAAAMATEWLFLKIRKKDPTAVLDGSTIITGILLVLTLPPTIPIFQVILGNVVAVAIGKQVFGGIGYNIFNPALVGRAFLQAAFPVDMTTWVKPFFWQADAISTATPLGAFKFGGETTALKPLLHGNIGGCIGETSALVILICGIILLLLKKADWRIPVSILATVAVFAEILYLVNPQKFQNPLFYLFSGGLMLGAFFMATDMVSSPITPLGNYIFGIGIGIVVMVIRVFGGLPEGVMFSILFMNSFVPLLNRYTKPKVFGEVKK